MLAIRAIDRSEVSNKLWFASSLLFTMAVLATLVIVSGGVGCIVVFEDNYCSNGRTIFAFVAASISIVLIILIGLVLREKVAFGSLGGETTFVILSSLLVGLWAAAVATTTFVEPFRVGTVIVANGFFGKEFVRVVCMNNDV